MAVAQTDIALSPSPVDPSPAESLKLPSGAPKVKLTARIGPVQRKSWHLRRPVSVIGSGRDCHVRVEDSDVSKAHCVLVNTGTEVLVRDLGSLSGTRLNDEPIELARLSDGDLLTLGGVSILIAIQGPRSGAGRRNRGMACAQPVGMPIQMTLRHADGQGRWPITDAVALVGRREGSDVFLDDPDVSLTHAVLAYCGERLVVCDAGSRTGTWVNGVRCTTGIVSVGDRLKWGQCEMTVEQAVETEAQAAAHAPQPTQHDAAPAPPADASRDLAEIVGPDDAETRAVLRNLEAKLGALQAKIADTWQQLNEWQETLTTREQALEQAAREAAERDERLGQRESELNGRTERLDTASGELDERSERLETERSQVDETRCRVDETQQTLEIEREEIGAQEADLKRRTTEAERTLAEGETMRTELEVQASKLARRESELAERTEAIDTKTAELERSAADLSSRTQAVEDRTAEIENRKGELAAREKTLASHETELEQAKADLEARQASFGERSAELERQTAELTTGQESFAERQADLEQREAAITDERETVEAMQVELEQREAEVASQRQALAERQAVIERETADLAERRDTLDHDGQAIEESRRKLEALQQELAHRDVGLTEQERALVEREKSVVSQNETAQMFRGLIDDAVQSFEKPLEIPKIGTNDAPSAEAATDPPAERDDVKLDLDEDTLEQLRVLRRMGNEGKTDEELLEQIHAQKSEAGPGSKKSWWSRR